MHAILTTERLLLRELTVDDADFAMELVNSPGWLKFIGDRNIKTKKAAVNYIENTYIRSYKIKGFGFWLVQLLDTDEPIGICGITKRDGLQGVDIGFAFLPAFNGKGYAYEIAAPTLHYVLTEIKLPFVLAITNPDNIRSMRLLEKIGLTFQEKIKLETDGDEVNLFRIENTFI